ncbi:hypothetical protein M1413_02550 [Patescibacteria group bacterium]|nr:hypothetical protein [Patescibacteria group bacterium]MCL5114704.1 hypothetical protein [Patescibacteria group bacterium]
MRKVDIFEEENSIVIDDQYSTDTFNFFPKERKFEVSSSTKNDVFYNNSTVEYKISLNPIELWMRTTELSHEPPLEYSIKDGVVLESEINKNKFIQKDWIEHLKKEVEWTKIPLLNNCEVNLYILSKHPEIISKDDYRRILRQSLEKIKLGVSKVEEAVREDKYSLQIETTECSKGIWYPESEAEKKERNEYYKLDAEKQKNSPYEKRFKYVRDFEDSLFKENSPKYVGISEEEFRGSDEIMRHLQKLLDKKESTSETSAEPKISKANGIIISLLLTLFISWVVSWFIAINPFLIFILVEIVAFLQGVIGSWIEKRL